MAMAVVRKIAYRVSNFSSSIAPTAADTSSMTANARILWRNTRSLPSLLWLTKTDMRLLVHGSSSTIKTGARLVFPVLRFKMSRGISARFLRLMNTGPLPPSGRGLGNRTRTRRGTTIGRRLTHTVIHTAAHLGGATDRLDGARERQQIALHALTV